MSTTTTSGGTKQPRTRRKPDTASSGSSGSGASSASGAQAIGDAGQQWARATPDTLAGARQDAQAISEGLAALGDALILRMNLEVDRSISPACVEPYQQAQRFLLQAAEQCQEVHRLLLARYGQVAEELAKPDTPDASYLKEGV